MQVNIYGDSLLHLAVQGGDLEAAAAVLEAARKRLSAKAFSDFLCARNNSDLTPVLLTHKTGQAEMRRRLVEAGADDTKEAVNKGTCALVSLDKMIDDLFSCPSVQNAGTDSTCLRSTTTRASSSGSTPRPPPARRKASRWTTPGGRCWS